jgi:hypothetical protein
MILLYDSCYDLTSIRFRGNAHRAVSKTVGSLVRSSSGTRKASRGVADTYDTLIF